MIPTIAKFSKKKQAGRYGKQAPPEEGSDTEAPVQAAIDAYTELLGLNFFRMPDYLWSWIHNPNNKVPKKIKILFAKALAGWPDTMIYKPLTGKYLIACPIEAKSRTGTWSSPKQKQMGEEMNYQIPRSPEQAISILNGFQKDAEKFKKIIEGAEDGGKDT